MTQYIALLKDDVAGTFKLFGVFNNVELAKRDFVYGVKQSPYPADLSLYIAGTIDTNTGCINTVSDDTLGNFPSYIVRGIENEI